MVVDLYFDGGSRGNPGSAGWGAVLIDNNSGEVINELYGYIKHATNNEAEYSGLIGGLKALSNIADVDGLNIYGDSKLVISQIKGEWKVKSDGLKALYLGAKKQLENFKWTATWVPREKNSLADALANKAMDTPPVTLNTAPCHPELVSGSTEMPVNLFQHDSGNNENTKNIVGDTIDQLNDSVVELEGTAIKPHHRSQAINSGIATEKPKSLRTTLFFVRHGETTDTPKVVLSGSATLGPHLSEIGLKETLETGKLIKKISDSPIWPSIEPPTEIISSPMLRAVDTAKQIQKSLPKLNINLNDNFKEFDFGIYDHWKKEKVAAENPDFLLNWSLGNPNVQTPEGDTFADLQNRVKQGIREVVDAHQGQTIIITSHAVAIRAILSVSLGLSTQEMMRLRIMPASLTVLSYWKDDETNKVVLGSDKHPKPYFLPELITQNMFIA